MDYKEYSDTARNFRDFHVRMRFDRAF